MNRLAFALALLALALGSAGARAAEYSPACGTISYVYGKMAAAAVNCNMPDSGAVCRPLASFLDAAKKSCGDDDASKWPETEAGEKSFYSEAKKFGQDAVCSRIVRAFLKLSK